MKFMRASLCFFCALWPLAAFAAVPAIPFTVTMSEAVNVVGSPRIVLDVDGNTRYAVYSAGTGTASLTFTYTATAGDVDLNGIGISSTSVDLNGGAITDLNGNPETNLTFTAPANMGSVNVNYPSLAMDFINDADGRYSVSGTVYNDLTSFLTATGGSFTRASTATYFDSAGTLQTAASGAPRFDYDPVTHAAKGILIEESRTNIFIRSSEIDSATWTKSNSTISANSMIAPDGTLTADKLIENNDINLTHAIQQTSAALASTYYTTTFYAKAAERVRLAVWFRGGSSGNRIQVGFDLTGSGATFGLNNVGNFTNGTSSITSIGNGWYRCIIIAQTGAGEGLIGTNIQLLNTTSGISTSSNYNGDGVSGVYVWGIQTEQGAFATSYIPTTTATVTRAADTLNIPTAGWYSSSAGTFYSQFFWGNKTTNARVMALSGGSAPLVNNNVSFPAQWRNWSGAAGPTVTSPITPSLATSIKAASAWKDVDASSTISASNSAVVTGSYTAGAYSGATMTIGSSGGSFFMDAPIKQLKYYPLKVTDTQLQLLTQ